MRAAVYTRYGPPEVVQVTEVDKPSPRDNELLVQVQASTVNRTDCGYRAGKPLIVRFFSGVGRPKAMVLGCEFAGKVEAVGAAVTGFKVGDRVFGYNEGTFGGHAEYLTIPASASVATIPKRLSFEQVAAGTEGAHYALSILRQTKVGDRSAVLVYGASGAIGSAAVQLLKSQGASVTAVCSTDHVELVGSLGADRVVDYLTSDFTEDSQRYDVVIDAVGKSSFGRCKRLLTQRGVYVSTELGPLSQNLLLAAVTPWLGGRQVRFPLPKHDQAMIRYLAELMETGQFQPVVDRSYPLEQIVDAYRYVETGRKIGSVLITFSSAQPNGEESATRDKGGR